MTIEEAIEEYLIEQTVRGNSPKTVADYRQKLGQFFAFVRSECGDVKSLTVRHCKDFYLHLLEKGVRSVSAQSYARSLRAFLRWLYLEEHIPTDLCIKFRLPKAKSNYIDVLTDDEIQQIYDCFPTPGTWVDARNRVILSLMLDCGLRMNEVVTAELRNLHLEERYLIVDGKGNKQRAVAFGNLTKSFIFDYLKRAPPASSCGRLIISGSTLHHKNDPIVGITRETIQNLFRRIKRRTNIRRLHPHLLRHSFATRYLENGGNIYSLQLLLGHTSLKMVQRYVHLCTTRIRREFLDHSPLDHL